jgi:hypothetical protein
MGWSVVLLGTCWENIENLGNLLRIWWKHDRIIWNIVRTKNSRWIPCSHHHTKEKNWASWMHVSSLHWLGGISIFNSVGNHFWPRLMEGHELWGHSQSYLLVNTSLTIAEFCGLWGSLPTRRGIKPDTTVDCGHAWIPHLLDIEIDIVGGWKCCTEWVFEFVVPIWGHSEPPPTSAPSTGCLLLLSCRWTSTELVYGFTLVTNYVRNRCHI